MFDDERATLHALRTAPGLFVGGVGAAAAGTAVSVAAGVPVALLVVPRNTQPVVALPLASILSVLVEPVALSGLYATIRQHRREGGSPGVARTVRRYLHGCRVHGRDLTAATAVVRAAALVPAAVALVVLLTGDTAVSYLLAAARPDGSMFGVGELLLALLWVVLAGAIGRLVVVFYDLPVLFGGVPVRRCARTAWRTTSRRPRLLVRYGTVRMLVWAPMVVVWAVGVDLLTGHGGAGFSALELATFPVLSLVVGTVVATVTATHHVVVYERHVESATATPTPDDGILQGTVTAAVVPRSADRAGGPDRRQVAAVAFAALLVVGAAVGTAAVRYTDERRHTTAAQSVGSDANASAVVEAAGRALRTSSYRARSRTYRVNGSTGERVTVLAVEQAVDREDRRARVDSALRPVGGDEWRNASFYASEGTLAFDFPGNDTVPRRVPVRERFAGRRAGEWGVLHVAGYRSITDQSGSVALSEGGTVVVAQRSPGRLVVRRVHRPDGEPPADGSHLLAERERLVVDRETGWPVREVHNRTYVDYENGTAVERWHELTVTTYERDDVTVQRPDALGPRGPVEWLWDLVYY